MAVMEKTSAFHHNNLQSLPTDVLRRKRVLIQCSLLRSTAEREVSTASIFLTISISIKHKPNSLPTHQLNIMSSIATTTRRVYFAAQEVSAVYFVDRKTASEAFTLFYQPEECDRFRTEARLENLARDLCVNGSDSDTASNIESLNALTHVARLKFQSVPVMLSTTLVAGSVRSHYPPQRSSKGTARIA